MLTLVNFQLILNHHPQEKKNTKIHLVSATHIFLLSNSETARLAKLL